MSEPFRIIITPTPGTEDCEINVGGEIYNVRGLAMFADGGDSQLVSFFWNSPAVAAAACVKSFAQAIRSENQTAIKFYQYLLRAFCKVTGTGANEMTPEDALRKFEAQELYDAMAKTSKKDWN